MLHKTLTVIEYQLVLVVERSYQRNRGCCSALLLVFLLLWQLWPWQAIANVRPRLAVLPLAGDTGIRATQAVSDAIADTQRVEVIGHAAVMAYLTTTAGNNREPLASLERANQMLSEGVQALTQEVDVDKALHKLEQAQAAFREQLVSEEAFDGWRATKFQMAICLLAKKEVERAKQELREIYVLDPDRETRSLVEAQYSTDFRALYNEVVKTAKAEPTGELLFEGTPAGTEIWINGRGVGRVPVKVSGLPVGEHYLRLEAPGYRTAMLRKFLAAGSNRYDVNLTKSAPVDANYFQTVTQSQDIDHHRAAFLDEMGVSMNADIFVLLSPGHNEVKGQLYDHRSQEVSKVVVSAKPDDLAFQLMTLINPEGYVIRGDVVADSSRQPILEARQDPRSSGTAGLSRETMPPRQVEYSDRLWQKRWFWLVVGGGLIVVAGGVWGVTQLSDQGVGTSTFTLEIP